MRVIFILLICFGLLPCVSSAGVNCTKPSTIQRKIVCTSPQLLELDRKTKIAYQNRNRSPLFRKLHKTWLKDIYNECEDETCLLNAYQAEIHLLTRIKEHEYVTKEAVLSQPLLNKGNYQIKDSVNDEWRRFSLFKVDKNNYFSIIDSKYIKGVLYVIYAVRKDNTIELLEYADNMREPFLIATFDQQEVEGFESLDNTQYNDHVQIDGDLLFLIAPKSQQQLTYQLGSRNGTDITDNKIVFKPRVSRFSRANIDKLIERSDNIAINIRYDDGQVERVIVGDENETNDDSWIVRNIVWHPFRAVFYFDNEGSQACIWRVDLLAKTLTKIVSEHEAMNAIPVSINGHEAVVYNEWPYVKVALSPAK